jgi:hypothetical protein
MVVEKALAYYDTARINFYTTGPWANPIKLFTDVIFITLATGSFYDALH